VTVDSRFPDSGWRPNASQELLLKACLWEGEPALEAWREWDRREVIEEVDMPSNRLFGLLWRNLDAHDVEHASMRKLRGAYMHTWFQNQTTARQAPVPLVALRDAGIDTLVLKGASLCPLYYRDWGVRAMEDLDILVPPQRARDAIAVLRELGAVPTTARAEQTVDVRPAAPFKHPADDWDVDLHWYSLFRSSSDAGMWEHAVPLTLNHEPTLAPGPTHQLIHVCTHGADYNEQAPIRWVADAYTVIAGGQVDWDLFEREARERLLTVVLASALTYLRDLVDAPVPPEVIQSLEDAPSRYFERAGFRATARPFSPTRTFWMLWERYRRLAILKPDGPRAGPVRSFYGYLSLQWGVDRPWHFPREAWRHYGASRSAA
jgi:hypothetical protein